LSSGIEQTVGGHRLDDDEDHPYQREDGEHRQDLIPRQVQAHGPQRRDAHGYRDGNRQERYRWVRADLPDALALIATITMTASAPKTNNAAASAIVSLVLTL
jgi:hypothetical protein